MKSNNSSSWEDQKSAPSRQWGWAWPTRQGRRWAPPLSPGIFANPSESQSENSTMARRGCDTHSKPTPSPLFGSPTPNHASLAAPEREIKIPLCYGVQVFRLFFVFMEIKQRILITQSQIDLAITMISTRMTTGIRGTAQHETHSVFRIQKNRKNNSRRNFIIAFW